MQKERECVRNVCNFRNNITAFFGSNYLRCTNIVICGDMLLRIQEQHATKIYTYVSKMYTNSYSKLNLSCNLTDTLQSNNINDVYNEFNQSKNLLLKMIL